MGCSLSAASVADIPSAGDMGMSRADEPVATYVCIRSKDTCLGLGSVVVITKGVKTTGKPALY